VANNKTISRLLEILPGTISWALLIAPVVFVFHIPEVAVYIIVIYTFLWLIKSIEMAYHLVGSFLLIKKNKKRDFLKECQNITTDISLNDIYHVVILATYNEPLAILRRSIQAIKNSHFPVKDKVFFTLAYEERGKGGKEKYEALKKEFKNDFKEFYGFMHPDGIEGEVRGKGGNITYSGRKILEVIKKKKIPVKNIVVTTLDADNCVSKDYLAYLTHEYIKDPDRKHTSFQPLPFFNNNYWKVTLINRVAAISSSFWQMIESHRPSRLRNFSAHAQSLETLIDTDFWSVKTIVEDGHQYWRTYFRYNGKHKVIPLFTEIFQDAVQADSIAVMLTNQYKQLRRWAWGVSDIPYVILETCKRWKRLPKKKTLINLFRLFEGHIMWATLAIMITLNNRMLIWFNPDFSKTVLSYNASYILSRLFLLALIGLFVLIYMSLFFAPKRKRRLSSIFMTLIQWILLPIVTIIFGAFPALDAQTRLIIGKKLEFWVTPKQIKTK
jgi:hypothetical protein